MQESSKDAQNRQPGSAAPSQGGLSWSTPASGTPARKAVPPMTAAMPSKNPPLSMKGAESSNTAKYLGMIVIGILAGVLIAWGYSAWRAPAAGDATGTAATSTANTTGQNSALGVDTSSIPALGSNLSLTIASPQATGTSVAVEKAVVSAPTWVVIYEDNNGKPGNALGAGLFFPGAEKGTVELLRATVSGKSYLAAEQVDNGDRRFSLKGDQFLTENGEVVWVTFAVK